MALDEDLSVRDIQQTGDAVQQCRFSTTGRAEQHKELSLCNVEVELFEDLDRTEVQVEIFDFYRVCHE